MLKAFLMYGNFEEVSIPAKRDRRGRRFGFARTVNVKEPERLVTKLNNIIIDSGKIMVNFPKFDRKPQVSTSKQPYRPPPKHKPLTRTKPYTSNTPHQPKPADEPKEGTSAYHRPFTLNKPNTSNIPHQPKPVDEAKEGTSAKRPHSSPSSLETYPPYPKKEALKPLKSHQKPWLQNNKKMTQKFNFKPPPRPRKPWAHRYYNVEEVELKRLENAYIGVVENPIMTYKIQEEFIHQGYFSIRATTMGSNLVLLESLEEGEMEALIEGAQDWLAT